jgi:hypothetical protein
MNLVQFGINIHFDEKTQIHTPARKVFVALGAKVGKARPTEPGTRVKNEGLGTEVYWNYEYCQVKIEQRENSSECIDLAVKYLKTVDSVARIGNLRETELVTEWIIPTPKHNFTSLNELYMRTMISQREFMQGTYDSGVILDAKIGDFILHHQSGPMKPEQLLNQFLVFKRVNLPKLFLFLYTSIKSTKVIQYSEKEMHDFLADAMHKCELHSKSFNEVWEGCL